MRPSSVWIDLRAASVALYFAVTSSATANCTMPPAVARISIAAAKAAFEQAVPAAKECFLNAIKQGANRDRVGTLGGHLTFSGKQQFEVSFDDQPLPATAAYFDAHAGRDFRNCLRDALAHTAFANLNTSAEYLQISFAYAFDQDGTITTVKLTGDPKIQTVFLSKDVVQATINNQIPDIRKLYENLLEGTPPAGGKFTVHFLIGSDGEVMDASIKDSTMGQKAFEKAVQREVESWCFPSGAFSNTVINYPFTFGPEK